MAQCSTPAAAVLRRSIDPAASRMGFWSRFCGASAAEAYWTPNSPFCLGRHSLAKDYS
jgi:hypothetical protein